MGAGFGGIGDASRAVLPFDAGGAWQHERKVADHVVLIKLVQEVIATQSKDLQLAAWLTESLVKTKGFTGLNDGLALCHGLVEKFWDTVYPAMWRRTTSNCAPCPSTGSAPGWKRHSRASRCARMVTISSNTRLRGAFWPKIRPRPKSRKRNATKPLKKENSRLKFSTVPSASHPRPSMRRARRLWTSALQLYRARRSLRR